MSMIWGSHSVDRQRLSVRVCGCPGEGALAAGKVLARSAAEAGYHALCDCWHPPAIRRSGRCVSDVTISRSPVRISADKVDVLVSLDDPRTIPELPQLEPDGAVVYDNRPPGFVREDLAIAGHLRYGMFNAGAPLRQMADEVDPLGGLRGMAVAGVVAALAGVPLEAVHRALETGLSDDEALRVETSGKALDRGYYHALRELAGPAAGRFRLSPPEGAGAPRVWTGFEAVATACLQARCRLFSGVDASPVAEIMARLRRQGGEWPRVVAADDPVAAVGYALGAGYAGALGAAAVAAGDMGAVERLLDLSATAEIPLVLFCFSDVGAASLPPGRSAQSALNALVCGGAGEVERAVLAPSEVGECHSLSMEAFRVAEAVQGPAVVLVDQLLAGRLQTADLDLSMGMPEPVLLARNIAKTAGPFLRYQITESGVSPFACPGMAGTRFTATPVAHDSFGTPVTTAEESREVDEKRLRKWAGLGSLWPGPTPEAPGGPLSVGVLTWGSSAAVVREAVNVLRGEGILAGLLVPRLVWPPQRKAVEGFAARCEKVVVVEPGRRGPFASLLGELLPKSPVRLVDFERAGRTVGGVVEELRGLV